eukprot:6530612-Alexandrium_andersonii.AAC.1
MHVGWPYALPFHGVWRLHHAIALMSESVAARRDSGPNKKYYLRASPRLQSLVPSPSLGTGASEAPGAH